MTEMRRGLEMVNAIQHEGRTIEPLTKDDRKDVASLKAYAVKNGFDIVYRVPVDITGAPHGFAHPTNYALEEGKVLGFDGSSLTGYQAINESDMKTEFLPTGAFVDTSHGTPKLYVPARIHDPVSGQPYSKDPINIALRAAAFAKQRGYTANFGPEPEFFLFDSVSAEVLPNGSSYLVESREGAWVKGKMGLGYQIAFKKGYAPLPPFDTLEEVREDIMRALMFNGVTVETGHHEVGTAGQGEIDMRYADVVTQAHQLLMFKHLVKNIARKHGLAATFLPKVIVGDNGSGMHVHQSLWRGEENVFAGSGYGGLSEVGLHYIGGILKHGPALCALTNPTTISYKRIVPHCEAPTNLVYSARNRSAAIRIPQYEPGNKKAVRPEVRFPDPMASGYIAFSAMLLAGMDGIEEKIDPGKPFDGNVWENADGLPQLPGSLDEALDALERDHEFLTRVGVFTDDFLQAWIALKREEAREVKTLPHPAEIARHFGS
jgi:glutamine synthetase